VDSASSGFGNLARWRALNDIRWSKNEWSASLTTRYVHHVYEAPETVAVLGTPGYVAKRKIGSWMQTDLQLGYHIGGDWDSDVQIGVRNITDELAPLIYSGFNGTTDMRTYDAIGRFFWMRYTARF
jgi:iron complex outermembrane recepter protein